MTNLEKRGEPSNGPTTPSSTTHIFPPTPFFLHPIHHIKLIFIIEPSMPSTIRAGFRIWLRANIHRYIIIIIEFWWIQNFDFELIYYFVIIKPSLPSTTCPGYGPPMSKDFWLSIKHSCFLVCRHFAPTPTILKSIYTPFNQLI